MDVMKWQLNFGSYKFFYNGIGLIKLIGNNMSVDNFILMQAKCKMIQRRASYKWEIRFNK